MDEKQSYSSYEVQNILKKAIQATAKGVLEYVNKESVIIDKFFKNEIPNAKIEIDNSNKVSEYINEELKKVGINYSSKNS